MSSLNTLPVLKPKKVELTEQPKSDKELERLRKIRERIIRNRASANASRQKKKEYMESLEKKNKELIQHKERIDKENQKLKDENENLKLQVQYLTQALNKMNSIYNDSQNSPMSNILLPNNNVYSLPINNNFTSDINSPESLSSVSLSSPLFNDIPVMSSTNLNILPNNNNINSNVNTPVSDTYTFSPQSSVGEPAALTNENSLQRTLFCQRIMYQILQTVILTKSLTTYLMMTLAFIIQTSAYRPLTNNNSYRNLYQKKNYVQPVPISVLTSKFQTSQFPNYHKNNFSKYWNSKSTCWKDKIT